MLHASIPPSLYTPTISEGDTSYEATISLPLVEVAATSLSTNIAQHGLDSATSLEGSLESNPKTCATATQCKAKPATSLVLGLVLTAPQLVKLIRKQTVKHVVNIHHNLNHDQDSNILCLLVLVSATDRQDTIVHAVLEQLT